MVHFQIVNPYQTNSHGIYPRVLSILLCYICSNVVTIWALFDLFCIACDHYLVTVYKWLRIIKQGIQKAIKY